MHRPFAHMAQADQGLSPAVSPGSAKVLLRPMLPPHKHKSLSDSHRQSGLEHVASSGPLLTGTKGKLCQSISEPPCAVDVSRFVCAYSMSSAHQTVLAWRAKHALWLIKIPHSRYSRHLAGPTLLGTHSKSVSHAPHGIHAQTMPAVQTSSRLLDNFLRAQVDRL